MGRHTSVALGDHLASFIDAQVQGGRYGSAGDVVRVVCACWERMKPRCWLCKMRSTLAVSQANHARSIARRS